MRTHECICNLISPTLFTQFRISENFWIRVPTYDPILKGGLPSWGDGSGPWAEFRVGHTRTSRP